MLWWSSCCNNICMTIFSAISIAARERNWQFWVRTPTKIDLLFGCPTYFRNHRFCSQAEIPNQSESNPRGWFWRLLDGIRALQPCFNGTKLQVFNLRPASCNCNGLHAALAFPWQSINSLKLRQKTKLTILCGGSYKNWLLIWVPIVLAKWTILQSRRSSKSIQN